MEFVLVENKISLEEICKKGKYYDYASTIGMMCHKKGISNNLYKVGFEFFNFDEQKAVKAYVMSARNLNTISKAGVKYLTIDQYNDIADNDNLRELKEAMSLFRIRISGLEDEEDEEDEEY